MSQDLHEHASTHACACTHVRTHTHKAKLNLCSHMKHSYCHPANQHRNAYVPLRHLSLVQANPLGGLQEDCSGFMERVCITWSSATTPTPLSKIRTVRRLLPPVNTGCHDVTAGWAASPVDTCTQHGCTRTHLLCTTAIKLSYGP